MNLPSTSINFSNCGIAEDALLNTIIVCSSDHPSSTTRGNALPTMSAIKLDKALAASLSSRKRSRNRFHMNWKMPPPTGREDSRDDANDNKPPKRKPKTTNTQVSLLADTTTSKLTSDIARKEDTLVSSEEIEHRNDMDSRVVSRSPRRSRNRALSEDEFEHQIFPTLVLPSLSK